MTQDYESWLRGIVCKRTPTVLAILADLVDAGLKYGECSANDITIEVSAEKKNCIGACFKLLRSLGFVASGRLVAAKARRKHGRRLFVWELRDTGKAQQFLRQARHQLLKTPVNTGEMAQAYML